ncbi:hypothetical protein N7510_006633 [Penicillium lagena]|uniref:uncharacterized protein n=1 Tax=Penicillium lagena TaxID=94218 RepID=UPI0025422933|nr:uncharacterized protein N7510_006633 [Penicillium lagena]KAJ5613439.1 hypothetical protein N7510_006633 [Penicillium lagena]
MERSPFALGGLRLLNGTALMSEEGQQWIESQACTRMAPDVLRAFRLPWQNTGGLSVQNLPSLHTVFELPPRSLIENLVSVYCSSFQCLAFPVISRSLLAKTLNLAYGQRGIHGFVSARTCTYAFLALVRLFGFDDGVTEEIPSLQYANEAERLLPIVIQEMTSDGLQTLNPTGISAAEDLKLLGNFPGMLRKIPIRRLTLAEMVQLEFLDKFTTELARLGRCTFEKAQLDTRQTVSR